MSLARVDFVWPKSSAQDFPSAEFSFLALIRGPLTRMPTLLVLAATNFQVVFCFLTGSDFHRCLYELIFGADRRRPPASSLQRVRSGRPSNAWLFPVHECFFFLTNSPARCKISFLLVDLNGAHPVLFPIMAARFSEGTSSSSVHCSLWCWSSFLF
jgi:hypothetical protein